MTLPPPQFSATGPFFVNCSYWFPDGDSARKFLGSLNFEIHADAW
jgi:hypothetical protein